MKRRLLVLASVAFIARVVFCFVVLPRIAAHTTVGAQPFFDSYREIAASLDGGFGYRLRPDGPPALHRPPGYTLLIALCDPADPARCAILFRLLHALVGALAALATYAAAPAWEEQAPSEVEGPWTALANDRQLPDSPRARGLTATPSRRRPWCLDFARHTSDGAATFAALVVALWPFTIWETKVTVPENLLVLLVPLTLLGIRRNAALAGVSAMWAALTHGLYPLFAIFTVLMMRRLRAAITTAIIIALPLALWSARNARLGYHGLAAGFGYHYFRGLHDFAQHDLADHDLEEQQFVSWMTLRAGFTSMESDDARSDPRVNTWLDHQARAHIRMHVGFSMVKTLTNMPKLWIRQQTPLRSALNALLLAPLFALAIRGVMRQRDLRPLALALLLMTAGAAAITSDSIPMRYALPMMPVLAVLAGRGIYNRAPCTSSTSSSSSPT